MSFLRTVQVTFFTLKRTRAFWLAIVAPLFIACFRFFGFLFNVEPMKDAWIFWIEGNYFFWSGILLLLTVALGLALLVDIDRSAQIWKYFFALPVSRTSVYLAKFLVAIVLMFMSGLLLLIASLVAGYLLSVLKPQLGFAHSSPDILYYLKMILLETIAAFLLIAIYTWISMYTKNFIFPIAISIAGMVVNIVGFSNVGLQKFSPWMYALDTNRILSQLPQSEPYTGWSLPLLLLISIVGAVIVTLLGAIEFNRRDIS